GGGDTGSTGTSTYYLDLGDRSRRAIAIEPGHWHLVDRPPIHFRRPDGLPALPIPPRDGAIALLRSSPHLAPPHFPLLLHGPAPPTVTLTLLDPGGRKGLCQDSPAPAGLSLDRPPRLSLESRTREPPRPHGRRSEQLAAGLRQPQCPSGLAVRRPLPASDR